MALGDHVTRTTFTPTALGGHTQLQLDIVKAHACTHMAGDFPVRNSVTHTNNHGYRLKKGIAQTRRLGTWINYRCESISFAIIYQSTMPVWGF
jgi:hypothetical protein